VELSRLGLSLSSMLQYYNKTPTHACMHNEVNPETWLVDKNYRTLQYITATREQLRQYSVLLVLTTISAQTWPSEHQDVITMVTLISSNLSQLCR